MRKHWLSHLNFSIYATSVWLSLSHDPFLVLLLFADLLVTVGSTAIPTSNFIFNVFIYFVYIIEISLLHAFFISFSKEYNIRHDSK